MKKKTKRLTKMQVCIKFRKIVNTTKERRGNWVLRQNDRK